ncbi:MAG TPA: hypothetical protein PKY73_15790 [Hyphomonas sp.]|nr:hypothetical protein [Hyphomonas sp.]
MRLPLLLAAALVLSACATGPMEKDWTGAPGAQPFRSASAACSQTSYNIEANFITCMAGRGWTESKK